MRTSGSGTRCDCGTWLMYHLRTSAMDLNHTRSYVPMDQGGPPGQTRLAGLGP